MKNILRSLIGSLLVTATLISCEKDENKVFLEGGTPPVLTSSTAGPMVLNIADKSLPAVTFTWTNPDYQFTTGTSSQDVTYTLQFDTTGANFTSPKKYEKVISKDLSATLTVGDLNAALLAMDLVENMPHNIEIRVKSNLVNNSAVLYSNVVKIVITPYLDVLYPVPTNLYITGGATPGGWQCGCGEPELLSQKFTKINSSTFELNLTLTANESYLFLPVYGSWSAKYGYINGGNANNVNGDDFKPGGNDMKAPALTALYKITVSFKTGKWTVVKI